MAKLLNIDANAKTIKGRARGYMTAVVYLAPYTASGINVCPMAELAGCHEGCLNTAGRGGISKGNRTIATDAGLLPDNAIQRARLARTALYHSDRDAFMRQLIGEIRAFIKKAERAGLIPVVRLNGTSDIQWELINTDTATNIFSVFPDVQFYDYTKIAKRFNRPLPSNYYLTLSYSEASQRYAAICLAAKRRHNISLVLVVRDKATKARYLADNESAVDGDQTDLRFLDPAGAVVVLYAKGRARNDTSGFVLDYKAA
jgi:hypothetical protein